MTFARRVALLAEELSRLDSLLVALSGGVDSAALLGMAARSVPGRVVAATTRSAAVPDEEIEVAREAARHFGVEHRVVGTREMADPRYRANDGERCYFCRVEMYGRLEELARSEGILAVADGLQADDAVADRPGVRAARELSVLHPLRSAGLGKEATRRLARALGWRGFGRPAQPCLASRLPRGVEVTPERLSQVHRAERALRAMGFADLRVRCEGSHGRVEIAPADLGRALGLREEIESLVLGAGFRTAALDPLGYRSGGAAGPIAGRAAGIRPGPPASGS